jgi:hypothetical protein
MWRDPEFRRNGLLLLIVEHALDDLQFPWR